MRYRFIYSICLENGVTMTPKRRLLTLIFACLCFKKSLLMNSFNLEFFRYASSSHQKKSACNISGAANTKKDLYFESFISGRVTALPIKEISLKFKLSYLL